MMVQRRKTCGTYAGAIAHTRYDDDLCAGCREAQRTYMREYRRRKRFVGSVLVPLDLVQRLLKEAPPEVAADLRAHVGRIF